MNLSLKNKAKLKVRGRKISKGKAKVVIKSKQS